ncbi:MAG: hypothetical protein K0S63_34, partial [Gammaproteobacteria bacterium]|nr:hypothetical protein [Gammaproteobacteria bacterium]
IMSPHFLDRLILGKGQEGYEKNKEELAIAGEKFIKKFMSSGLPEKKKKSPKSSVFNTITRDFSIVRLKVYNYLESKIKLEENKEEKQNQEEKQSALVIQETAVRALKRKWEKLCRQFNDPKTNVQNSNYVELFNTIGCLFKASHLPDYITSENLIKFANIDPGRFFSLIENLDFDKNNSFLRRLGDLSEFKQKLKAEGDNHLGSKVGDIDKIKAKLDILIQQEPKLTLDQAIAFKLMEDSNNKPEAVKIAMRAAADNLLHVLDEAVPGTSTKEYRQMVYAHAKQATANIFNKIDKEIQENPTNNAEEKSNKILSYLEALKIEWEVEQETFKFKQKDEIHHKDRMRYLEDCIKELRKNENNSQEWVILPNISTALGNFNEALDNISQDFRGTKNIKENLSRLKEEYITPKKSVEIKQEEKSETKLSESNPKNSPRKTSTASMFSLFAHRKQPSQETIQNSNDLKNTTKPMKP